MPNAPRIQSREMGHRLGHEIGQRCHAQRRLIKVGVLKEHVHPNGHFALQRIGLSNLRQALAPDIDLASGRHLGWADAITAQAVGFSFVEGVMIVSGTITLFVAGFFLIRQHNVKRMFAYHSIVHMGVIAFALGVGGKFGLFAAIFHCLAHSFTKALAFCSTGNIARIYGHKDMSKMGGMVKIAPITTIMFGAAVCSLVGVPAFAIFVSEYNVFVGAITSGQYIAVALFAIALAVIFIADFAHFNMASFGEPKGVVVHNKEMSLFENLPLIALCALIIIFGVWHVDSFYTLVNNGVNIMMGALK